MEVTEKLVIFVSSPGDVQEERLIADRVIRKLQKEYNSVVELVPVIWENLPLTAAYTFQEGIDAVLKQSGVDIAIFILGSRLGTSPGNNYLYPNGDSYKSGTEYEYDFMQQMYRKQGRPEMLVYVKQQSEKELLKKYSSLNEVREASFQNELVKQFIQERFEDKKLGAYLAYHQVTDGTTFEIRLTVHLRSLLQKLLGNLPLPHYVGNPYKGLMSFEEKDEYIFFGRGQEVQALENNILEYYSMHSSVPFVFICGQSGAGKSSFIKAGVLPDIKATGLVCDSLAVVSSATPQQFSGNLSSGILDLLKNMLPELLDNKYFNALYQKEDISTQDVAVIDDAITGRAKSGKQFIPVILLDQFEEFFTGSNIGIRERHRCKKLLAALQMTGKIMFIFCLRSDFYHFLTDDEIFFKIRKEAVVWDVSPFSTSELCDIIEEPARLAGCSWEKDAASGKMLCSQILDDALKLQCLPLLEFALTNLYEKRQNNVMTFASYREIGGIVGAIESYASAVFESLDNAQKEIFFKLLSLVISISDDGIFCRKDAVAEDYNLTDSEQTVLEIMVKRRLFYASRNSSDQAVFSIAHEFLINNWGLVKAWIQRERELISQRLHFEKEMKRWNEHNQNPSYLITNNVEIDEANDLLLYWEEHLPRSLYEYLLKSIKYVSGQWKWFILFLTLLLFFFISPIAFIYLKNHQEFLWRGINIDLLMLFFVFRKFYSAPFYKKVYLECSMLGMLVLSMFAEIFYYWDKDIGFWMLTDWYFIVMLWLIYKFVNDLLKIRIFYLKRKGRLLFNQVSKIEQFLRSGSCGGVILSIIVGVFFVISGLGFILKCSEYILEIRKAAAAHNYIRVNQLLLNAGEINFAFRNQFFIPEIKYLNAKHYYDMMLPVKALEALGGDSEEKLQSDDERLLCYNIYVDLNRGNEKVDFVYENPYIRQWDKVGIALTYGDESQAVKLAEQLSAPDTKRISLDTMNYANWLLLVKKDAEKALQIYRKHLYKNNEQLVWNNELRYNFARLKKCVKFVKDVEAIEKAIELAIPIYSGPGIDIAKELPALQGKWVLANKEVKMLPENVNLYWDIDSEREVPSRYSVISNSGGEENFLNRDFSHLKIIKFVDDLFVLEQYFPRGGRTYISFLKFVDNDTLIEEVLFNGNDDEKKQIRIYGRIKSGN